MAWIVLIVAGLFDDATNVWQAVSMVALVASIVAVKLTAPS